MTSFVLVDGERVDAVSVTDSSVLRGDGCFEAIRSYAGSPFALGWHLDRLERSASLMDLRVPDRVGEWCREAAARGDGIVRVVLTRGDLIPGGGPEGRCLVMHLPLPRTPTQVSLKPVPAPWHPAGRTSELAGAKTLSYAPNAAATRSAKSDGFDDALLVSDEGIMLEGPTFAVAWVVDDVIETPALDLYVLDSITRRTMEHLAGGVGWTTVQVRRSLDRLDRAGEVMAMSTVKEIVPVVAVGERRFDPGPITDRLASRFAEAVSSAMGV